MADRPARPLGRSVADLTTIVNDLGGRGVQFRSLTEAIDTTTVGGELVFYIFAAVAQMERRLISERTRAGLAAARARGRAGGRPTVMTGERLTAAQAMRAQGMTLIQIAATLGVGRSSLVRALAQTPNDPASEPSTGPEQTVIQLPGQAVPPAESVQPPSAAAPVPEVRLLGRSTRRGAELEELVWPAGYFPACPACTLPTTGVEEQYARVSGQREPVIVALAQPCGCLVDEHVTALLAAAPNA